MEITASRIRTNQALVLIGAGAIVVGSFLPWATMRAALVGQVDFAGTDGDGAITLVLGALIAAMAWTRIDQRGWRITILISCALIALIAGVAISNLSRIVGEMATGTAAVGSGLYLVLIGAVLAGVALLTHSER